MRKLLPEPRMNMHTKVIKYLCAKRLDNRLHEIGLTQSGLMNASMVAIRGIVATTDAWNCND